MSSENVNKKELSLTFYLGILKSTLFLSFEITDCYFFIQIFFSEIFGTYE